MVISILLMLIYVICSALGLTLLKLGLNNKVLFSFNSSGLEIKFPMLFIIGAILYICSFLLNMIVVSKFNLSYAYPISAGLIYIAIIVFSVLLLKENVTITQIIGMAAILIGKYIMKAPKKFKTILLLAYNCLISWERMAVDIKSSSDPGTK